MNFKDLKVWIQEKNIDDKWGICRKDGEEEMELKLLCLINKLPAIFLFPFFIFNRLSSCGCCQFIYWIGGRSICIALMESKIDELGHGWMKVKTGLYNFDLISKVIF